MRNKGYLKMPTDKVMFHLGRLTHVAISCVGCGMCELYCPNNVPIFKMFKIVGLSLQKSFEYTPGRSIDEPLPITIEGEPG
jgi:formate dehydrogenase subunit beta